MKMRVVLASSPGEASLREVDIPPIGESHVLVKVSACGFCTTDHDILAGHFWGRYPIVPGHEISGTICERGKHVDTVDEGDRVSVDPNLSCRTCRACRSGMPHMCEKLRAIGVTEPGGFAEYLVAPAANLYRLDTATSMEAGALAEPVACVLHAIARAAVVWSDTVVIHGAGFIGLLFERLLKLFGVADVILTDPSAARRELAQARGVRVVLNPSDALHRIVEETGGGASVSVDCTGVPEVLSNAMHTTRPGGRILMFGVPTPKAVANINPYDIFRKELTIVGSFINPFMHEEAVRLISRTELRDLITHRFRLSEFRQAWETKHIDPYAVKVMIEDEHQS